MYNENNREIVSHPLFAGNDVLCELKAVHAHVTFAKIPPVSKHAGPTGINAQIERNERAGYKRKFYTPAINSPLATPPEPIRLNRVRVTDREVACD